MKKIGISIINYKNAEITQECIQSLEKLTTQNLSLQVYVINNSTEGLLTTEMIKHSPLKKQITISNSAENTGFTGGHNSGIKKALADGVDYVLILNNDVVVDSKFLEYIVYTFTRKENIGVVVPKIYFFAGDEFHKERYKVVEQGKVIWYAGGKMDWHNVIGYHEGVDEVDNGQYDIEKETEIATGCCMLVKREVFEKVGLFDNRYFLYYEDSDLSMRIRAAGYTIYYSPRAFLWHRNAYATGGVGSTLQDYYITRNRLLFGMRYATLRTKIALFRESLRLLFAGRTWQRTGIVDFYMQKFGKGSFTK